MSARERSSGEPTFRLMGFQKRWHHASRAAFAVVLHGDSVAGRGESASPASGQSRCSQIIPWAGGPTGDPRTTNWPMTLRQRLVFEKHRAVTTDFGARGHDGRQELHPERHPNSRARKLRWGLDKKAGGYSGLV